MTTMPQSTDKPKAENVTISTVRTPEEALRITNKLTAANIESCLADERTVVGRGKRKASPRRRQNSGVTFGSQARDSNPARFAGEKRGGDFAGWELRRSREPGFARGFAPIVGCAPEWELSPSCRSREPFSRFISDESGDN